MGVLRTYPLQQVFDCFFEDFSVRVGSAISIARNASANFTRYARQTTAAINNETFCIFTLTPGNYTFTLLYGASPAGGIAIVRINGVIVTTIDTYASTIALTLAQVFFYSVMNNRSHTLSIAITSKNVASTGYDFYLTRVSAKVA